MTESEAIQYYTELYFKYEDFHNAAVQAAWDAGEQKPKGFWKTVLTNINYSENHKRFEDSRLSQQQVQYSLPNHARNGATAYVRGQEGNYYTDFLHQNFGPNTGE